jgi:hypothetical protein
MENHPMTEQNQITPASKRPRKMAREPNADTTKTVNAIRADRAVTHPGVEQLSALIDAPPTKPQTKASLVEALLSRSAGASLDDLCQATGWLPHTCRAFLTGLRKKGKTIVRSKREDGTTIYKLGTGVSNDDAETGASCEAAA